MSISCEQMYIIRLVMRHVLSSSSSFIYTRLALELIVRGSDECSHECDCDELSNETLWWSQFAFTKTMEPKWTKPNVGQLHCYKWNETIMQLRSKLTFFYLNETTTQCPFIRNVLDSDMFLIIAIVRIVVWTQVISVCINSSCDFWPVSYSIKRPSLIV